VASSATFANIMPPVTTKTMSGKISGDQPQEGIDDYEGKDSEKRKVLRQEWKML